MKVMYDSVVVIDNLAEAFVRLLVEVPIRIEVFDRQLRKGTFGVTELRGARRFGLSLAGFGRSTPFSGSV